MKRRRKDGLGIFLALLALYGLIFGARWGWRAWVNLVVLEPEKPLYFHDEIIRLVLRTRDPELRRRWAAGPPRVLVTRNGQPVTTIASLREVPFAPDPETGEWTALWPCPWNAEPGPYVPVLTGPGEEWRGRVVPRPFRIGRRKPAPLPKGLSILTLESVSAFKSLAVPAPGGGLKDWRGLLDWVEATGADALWVLGGQTPGDKPGEVWMSHNDAMIPVLARECHRRGIKFGVYAMCFLTMSKERLPRYEYAREVEDGRTVLTRAVSLRDPRRVEDIIAKLKSWRDIPDVDFVGLDYIRNALGGYELAEDFFREMPGVKTPPGWDKFTPEERMVYLARKKVMRRDLDFIDAWQWWRAHKVGGIVRRVKAALGDEKPLWAFTLTWDKGWNHGQDPVMMNDAGVDADALMLYEADREQFDALLRAWSSYVRRGDVQLVVGDVVDWPLHQRAPEGPKEFYRRATAAIDGIYADGPAFGVFVHDLGRAFWGRVGPWGTRGWMDETTAVIRHMKERAGVAKAGEGLRGLSRKRRGPRPAPTMSPAPSSAPVAEPAPPAAEPAPPIVEPAPSPPEPAPPAAEPASTAPPSGEFDHEAPAAEPSSGEPPR